MDEPINILRPQIKITAKKEPKYNKETLKHNCSMLYYYDDPNDIKSISEGGLNLPFGYRPWYSFKKKSITNGGEEFTEIVSGREAFNDPVLYRPVDMSTYIRSYFIDPYIERGRRSPFMFHKDSKNSGKGFQLNPQQKFVGQFISYDTDFPGALYYHGIGAGKTFDAATTALAFVAKYKAGDTFKDIDDRKVCIKDDQRNYCSVTIVVPKNLLNDYVDTFVGKVQNVTGMCVIYCENDNIDNVESYRQFYQGNTVRDSSGQITFENPKLKRLTVVEDEIEKINNKITLLQQELHEDISDNEKDIIINQLQQLQKKLEEHKREVLSINKSLTNSINDLYFIVSHETFISRLRQQTGKRTSKNNIEYTVSDFVLGKKIEFVSSKGAKVSYRGTKPIHPDCLHSNKTLIIIDEVQRLVSEGGSNYDILFSTLFIYARSFIDGKPTTKVVLMTATPVHNTPHQMALMMNLIRGRLMLPRKSVSKTGAGLGFNECFIDQNKIELKNPLLLKYALSGYVSYLKGGSTQGYPYRRNHVVLHKMGSVQYNQYKDRLAEDIEKLLKEKGNIKSGIFDDDEKIKSRNIYRNSGNISVCAFPSYKGSNQEAEFKKIIKDGKFGDFSSKLKAIGDRILNSKGTIFVYSAYVRRALTPLIYYLESHGFEFIGKNEGHNQKPSTLSSKKKLRYGIWSGTLYSDFKKEKEKKHYTIPEDESEFRSKMKYLFNSKENVDGSVCKVIIGNITEGVSFMRVHEIHLIEPWWNESKMEQIIGRGIRYQSHADMPLDQQYVDVFYHCSVFPNYPNKDESILSKLGFKAKKCDYCKEVEKKQKESEKKETGGEVPMSFKQFLEMKKKEAEKEAKKAKEGSVGPVGKSPTGPITGVCTCEETGKKTGIQMLSYVSIEQRLFMVASMKNKLNKQFEMSLKECAVDYELNKYGNVSRLEEYDFPLEGSNILKNNEKFLYDRATNKFFKYIGTNDGTVGKIYHVSFPNIDSFWPPQKYTIESELTNPDILQGIRVLRDDKGREMIYIDIIEEIESFNNNPEYNNKNFYQLKDYAIKVKGEEEKAWNEIERLNKVNDMITVLAKYNHLNITPAIILEGFKGRELTVEEYLGK
jgi:hypothetical protein